MDHTTYRIARELQRARQRVEALEQLLAEVEQAEQFLREKSPWNPAIDTRRRA